MYYQGSAKLDKRTKNLVKRLKPSDIAIIDHEDLDRVTAESLLENKVEVVVNARSFVSGRYPNVGPLLLSSAGVHLIDKVGTEIFEKLDEGDWLTIEGGRVFRDKELISEGGVLTVLAVQAKLDKAKEGLSTQLEEFAVNTLEYMQKEKHLLSEESELPPVKTNFKGRHVLVVVRGYDYKADLKILRSYIRERKPLLIGVDGGADALLKEGYRPDIIIGDMDSVTDEALLSGSELIVHAYSNGEAPGLTRLKDMCLSSMVFKSAGTSEDTALLLAYEKGAELIVAVGTHAHLVEFLDKGRKGMASTFLVRLKVGEKLVDAKGVNQLYQSRVKVSYLLTVILSALVVVTAVVMASPMVRQFLRLLFLTVRSFLGI